MRRWDSLYNNGVRENGRRFFLCGGDCVSFPNASQSVQHLLHVCRQLRLELNRLFGCRMDESYCLSMQRLTSDELQKVLSLQRFLAFQASPRVASSTIGRISKDWVPDVCQMDTNLMRSPRSKFQPHKR